MQGVCKSEMNLAPDRQFERIKQEISALMSRNRTLEKKLAQNMRSTFKYFPVLNRVHMILLVFNL